MVVFKVRISIQVLLAVRSKIIIIGNSDMITVRQHSNLLELDNIRVGWSWRHALEDNEPSELAKLVCIEVRCEGICGDNKRYEDGSNQLNRIALEFADSINAHSYLVEIGDRLSPKSRLKTYKGLFSRKGMIAQGDFCEAEIERQGQSFFVGVARVDEVTRDEAFLLARDRFRNFVVFSEAKTSQKLLEELNDLLTGCLRFKNLMDSITIDYLKLIPKIAPFQNAIVTFGMDNRSKCDYVNMRVFTPTSLGAETLDRLQKIAKKETSKGPDGLAG